MPALTPPRDLVKLWRRVAPSSSCNVHKNTSLVVAGAATNNNHTMHWLGWIGVAPMPHHVHVQNIIKKEMLRFLELQKYKEDQNAMKERYDKRSQDTQGPLCDSFRKT
jgi:hypothetical protein